MEAVGIGGKKIGLEPKEKVVGEEPNNPALIPPNGEILVGYSWNISYYKSFFLQNYFNNAKCSGFASSALLT